MENYRVNEKLECKIDNCIDDELGGLCETKMKGSLRSRDRWVAAEEKVTQYFFALDERNGVS